MNPSIGVSALTEAWSCFAKGEYAEAESISVSVLNGAPDQPDALLLIGLILNVREAYRAAVPVFERLTQLQPQQPAHWINLGTALRSDGDFDAALTAYGKAAALGEASADFLFNAALLQFDRGAYAESRLLFRQALAQKPLDAELRLYYALCCYESVLNEEVWVSLQSWPDLHNLTPRLLAKIGGLLIQIGETKQGEIALRRAIDASPGDPPIELALIQMLERTNQLDEANHRLEALLLSGGVGKENAEDLLSVEASLAQRAGNDSRALIKLAELMAITANKKARQEVLFRRAKSEDALGLYSQAFQTLTEAHQVQAEFLRRSAPAIASGEREMLAITQHGASPNDVARWADRLGPEIGESPIFVVGFPRSGTTLLEQTLDAHPMLRSMDEQPFLKEAIDHIDEVNGRYPTRLAELTEVQCEAVRREYWRRVATKVQLEPGQRLIDKNPLNLLRLPAIRRLFPRARIILAVRHPCDVILSCFMQHFLAPEFALVCRDLESLALGYRRAFDFWYREAELLKPSYLELRYDDFVAHFDAKIPQLTEFLQVPTHQDMFDPARHAQKKGFISTPSYSQVVEPVNARAVGRWRHYETWFRPVLEQIRPYLNRWGYDS